MLASRKFEMEEMANHHAFDEGPEGDAVGKKLIRGKWLKDDRGEKASLPSRGSATTITR